MEIFDSINYAFDLEEDILGIAIVEPLTAVYIAQHIHKDWFYYDFNALVFDVICKRLSEFKHIDHNTVVFDIQQICNSRQYNNENISYLVLKMTLRVISSAHISDWCEILHRMYENRQIERISLLSAGNLSTDEKKSRILALMTSGNIARINTSWVKMGNAVDDYIEYYQKNYGNQVVGLKTGLQRLDWLMGGFRPETFWIIAARPSIGKSALAQQIITNISASGKCVGVVSIEMGNNELISRMLAYKSGINFEDIYRMKVPIDALIKEAQYLKSHNVLFSDQTKCSIEGIRLSVQKLQSTMPLDILFIDYLQLMSSEAKVQNKNDEITKISGGLKELSRMMKIPIVALAQLNRAGKDKPTLENLRDGGSIEQDADGVIFIHGDREMSARLASIAKNRNGKLGDTNLDFNGSKMMFTEVENDYQPAIESQTF